MLFLGIDVGSSSVKVSVFDASKGRSMTTAQFPDDELAIQSPKQGWAEQDPSIWWESTKSAIKKAFKRAGKHANDIKGIGISYQMHGLVLIDKNLEVLRPSIIWCDSRAVEIGERASREIGVQRCLTENLNSPGNFTASKLAWVKANQPEVYEKIHKVMLPGDFIALRLSGECATTSTGMSEGIFWDFPKSKLSDQIFDHFGFDKQLIPTMVPTIGEQATVNQSAAKELGIPVGTPITYRAGDQPNNAFSLNVLNPGELAATAGTSAVIYAVTDQNAFDEPGRGNTFLHVNDLPNQKRNGVLVCVNGSGIYYNWIRRVLGNTSDVPTYEFLNELAAKVKEGSEGLISFPFGNGAERILQNKEINASIHGLSFNMHHLGHIVRAAKEGIVYAMNYGLEILKDMKLDNKVVRAGNANLFLSPVFREIFVNTTGMSLELFSTNGAEGAARAAALGLGFYSDFHEAFENLECVLQLDPEQEKLDTYQSLYDNWKEKLATYLETDT